MLLRKISCKVSYTNDAIFRNEKFNSKKNRENVDVDIVHSEPG